MLKPPFPWFGGKSRVAHLVWARLGDVANYVEPFFGSGAVLFGRPTEPRVETANDKDAYLANFWRALKHDPDGVAHWADWPVNEADLHARHLWLLQRMDFRERMSLDPDFYDAKIAGWWAWGICCWIGSGWCDERFYGDNGRQKRPHLETGGKGIHRMGVHRPSQQLPHLGDQGRGNLLPYMRALAQRLRRVRVCCGDWARVCGPSPTYKNGLTGVFLDPPYSEGAGRAESLYGVEDLSVAHEVKEWAVENGDNPQLRIAFCGYEGEHDFPADWECVPWKASGGYSSQGEGNDNPHRERIWFSPHCLKSNRPKQISLFRKERK